ERLCGYYIYVERDYLPELVEGEYYFFQVLGCQVWNESGDFVGTVEDIIETGSNDVMVIRRQDGFNVHEELIPLIKDYIVSMDFERKIVIARSLDYEEVR
ncbi:MAG TPA: ribosome maturation factor RimM, partial [Mesotoga infera]|nr:ribosome maturation factor RimM [Mesotoga infera]